MRSDAADHELDLPVGRLRRPGISEPARPRRPRERVAHGDQEGLRRTALPLEGEKEYSNKLGRPPGRGPANHLTVR